MRQDFTVRGTRDFYPEQYARLRHLFEVWRSTALSYGFEEFEGPILETLELYTVKSGDEIVRQLYEFTDKGGRRLALRPELTPTVARMVAAVQSQIPKPIKWFSIPRCMRYEKSQKGRLREFFQLNVDIIGEASETADLEVISVAVDCLLNLGLGAGDFEVRINNRDFVSAFFRDCAVGPDREQALFKIIDNASKVPPEATKRALDRLDLQPRQRSRIMGYLGAGGLRDLERLDGPGDGDRGRESLLRLFRLVGDAGLAAYCRFDPTIVRGLDYYTGTVFEIFDRSGEMRAVCGGGRYNNLLSALGGADIPACGFGMGDVVLGQILESRGLYPSYDRGLDYYLVRVSDRELPVLLGAARALRSRGLRVEYAYSLQPVKKQMSRASRAGARRVLVFGEEEIGRGKLTEKELATGEEREVDIPGSSGSTGAADIFPGAGRSRSPGHAGPDGP
jgi:histidyl-tRNA synthetase